MVERQKLKRGVAVGILAIAIGVGTNWKTLKDYFGPDPIHTTVHERALLKMRKVVTPLHAPEAPKEETSAPVAPTEEPAKAPVAKRPPRSGNARPETRRVLRIRATPCVLAPGQSLTLDTRTTNAIQSPAIEQKLDRLGVGATETMSVTLTFGERGRVHAVSIARLSRVPEHGVIAAAIAARLADVGIGDSLCPYTVRVQR